jgi:hypothetical protein
MRALAWLVAVAGVLAVATAGRALAADLVIPAEGLLLRGALGGEQIQMRLRAKPDDEGVEGEYFVFGQGRQILLAGEFEKDGFWMEESANGTDVSGQWEGERRGQVLSGTWRGMNASDERPFILNVVKSGVARPAPPKRKSAP